jgi:pyruvate/2-oxoacid:ferredoxin oxidoreductase alpha subunit
VAEDVDKEYKERLGRGYGLLECYRLKDAETVLVTAATIGSTAKVAIDALREEGRKVGMVRIRLFRPFPKVKLIESLKHAKKIAVIDRNLSPGQEGVFCEELKSALYSRLNGIPVFGFVLGLGGTNVSPSHIKKVFDITEKMRDAPLKPIVNIEDEDAFGI